MRPRTLLAGPKFWQSSSVSEKVLFIRFHYRRKVCAVKPVKLAELANKFAFHSYSEKKRKFIRWTIMLMMANCFWVSAAPTEFEWLRYHFIVDWPIVSDSSGFKVVERKLTAVITTLKTKANEITCYSWLLQASAPIRKLPKCHDFEKVQKIMARSFYKSAALILKRK